MADVIQETGLPLVNAQTNAVESVPWDQAHQALTTGTHNLQAGTSTNVVSPEGALVSLPSEQVPDALQSGYKIPSQEHITDYNQQLKFGTGLAAETKAAAAAAARAASFGTSDVALTQSGLVNPETLKQLQERNPTADTIGTIAGIGGSLLLPGLGEAAAVEEATARAAATGMSEEGVAQIAQKTASEFRAGDLLNPVQAVSKLGAGATEAISEATLKSMSNPETSPIVAKILAQVNPTLSKTLGSAVEGAVYGLGQSVSEQALGDPGFNAENLLHNVGYNALFAGGIGAALGLGGETLKAVKATFGKDVMQAAAKDAIIENAALHPTPQMMEQPSSIEEIQKHLESAAKEGYTAELPAKSRLLETNDILAGDSAYPAHSLQVQSLSSPTLRDIYKTALENPASEDGQILRQWEAVQKREGSDKLLPKYIQDIAPEHNVSSDPVESGNRAIKSFTDQYKEEQATLKPFFKEFDKQAVSLTADPTAIMKIIDTAVPEAQKFIIKDPEGWGILKYEKTMPFSKDAHEALSSLLDVLNKPEGATIAELRNLRETMRDNVNFLTAPRPSREISSIRRAIMDLMQEEVQKNAPKVEIPEGLSHAHQSPLSDPRELFKRYAINEENRSIIEQILGGSIGDIKTFAREIKPEEVLNRIFGNTVYVKAAKDILGADFDKLSADYLAYRKNLVTDPAKNGFSSNKFATFLKQKGPELEEALAQHPEQLRKINAVTDKMRILPDSPSVNPSGTAKTNLIQKIQNMTGYLTKDGIMSIPGKVVGALGEAYGEMQQHNEFNRILRSGGQAGSEEQMIQKAKQYGAYSKIERMQQSTFNAIDRGASSLFKIAEAGKGALAQKLIPKEDKYEKLQTHLLEMTGNPEKLIDSLSENTKALHAIAPDINTSLNATAAKATQFLRSKLPNPGQSSALTEPYKPSKSEIARFNRYAQAVENPLDVLRQLRQGDLTSEAMEAVQTVYPQLVGHMQKAISDRLNEKSMAKLPYQQKLLLSAFMGLDLTNSLAQTNIASAQLINPPPPAAPAPKQKGHVNPSQKGLGHLNESKQLLTPQQMSNQRVER